MDNFVCGFKVFNESIMQMKETWIIKIFYKHQSFGEQQTKKHFLVHTIIA